MMRRCALWSSPSAHTRPFPRTFATGGRKAGDLTVAKIVWVSVSASRECGGRCHGGRGRVCTVKICHNADITHTVGLTACPMMHIMQMGHRV